LIFLERSISASNVTATDSFTSPKGGGPLGCAGSVAMGGEDICAHSR
jgi:hypothetical protein